MSKGKKKIILKTAVTLLMALTLAGGAVFGAACKNNTDDNGGLPTIGGGDGNGGGNNGNKEPEYTPVATDKPSGAVNSDGKPVILPAEKTEGETYIENKYSATTAVGFNGAVKGTVERYRPVEEVMDGGLASGYPKYGSTLGGVLGSDPDKEAARDALINESDYLCAKGTRNNSGNGENGAGTYTWMDKDGYLYSGTTAEPVPALDESGARRRLYKHTTAIGNYLGDVSDDEPGIVKEVTIRPRGYGSYSVTGIYAPAGEVIKIQMSEADMNATGGITVHIGQALYNGQSNNIWTAKNQMQRFPNILNTMNVNKSTATLENGVYTAYVGSFVGGPLYIRNTLQSFTATVSGGVKYSHFILGYTTKEEFEEDRKSSAPYFDLEVWNYGVLHSGPKIYAKNFTYDDLYKAAVLWEKVSSVTTTKSNQGIVFLYDPFVAAGAAVAFPGRSSVNCPLGWMAGSLNYNAIVTSGSWGNFHEYHHNFQGYGVGNGGEVTNNGMTLVSYALFTKISSKRGITNYGAQGLGGWNNYTSATLALSEVLRIPAGETPSNGKQGLALYATLLHNFGANNYIQAKVAGGGQSYAAYMNAWQKVTHNNMYYYFNDLLQGTDITNNADPSYPMFVPVSSVYQTGRSYLYDGEKKYFKTMQPYVITYGEDFNIDLGKYTSPDGQYESGSIVIPEGFSYKVKNVTKPQYGKVEVVDAYNIKYTPDDKHLNSGEIIVTLSITKDDNAFKVEDVDLVLEFEQSHETNKTILERTTYTYDADSMYKDAKTAYGSSYAGYEKVTQSQHSNPVQNCNTDIWFYPDTEENRKKYPDSPDSHFVHDNTIEELKGKLYFDEAGTYRIYLRGRTNCAFYYSIDGGKTYKLGASITDGNSANFRVNDANTFVDLTLEEHSWVYFKSVLIVQSTPSVSFMGLGTAKWQEPMFTIVTKHYDADGNEVPEGSAGIVRTETHYYDYQGKEVSEETANKAELIPPTSASYVNAYRCSYEFATNTDFEADYFYTRSYTASYSDAYTELDQSIVSTSGSPANYPIENLIDGNPNTVCSSDAIVTEAKPWEITVDLGEIIEANRFELTGFLFGNNAGKNQTPNSFILYVGETLDNMKEVLNIENGKVNGILIASNFETSTFRYYKIVVRKTVEGRFAAINKIVFSNTISDGRVFSPDEDSFLFNDKWQLTQTASTFGHVYTGNAGAEMSFKFNGTRLALMSAIDLGTEFEVYIDGKKADGIALREPTNGYDFSYISEKLSEGTHSVTVKCTGKANIDSVIIYE